MKLLTHSLIPTTPTPYLHLGYISAQAMNTANFGWLWFVACVIVGIHTLKNPRFSRRAAKVVASCCFLLGIAILISAQMEAKVQSRAINSHTVLVILNSTASDHVASTGIIPSNIKDAQEAWELTPDLLKDGWGHKMRLTCLPATAEEIVCVIYSAGRDGSYSTEDDIGATLTFDASTITALRGEYLIRQLSPQNDPATRAAAKTITDPWGQPYRYITRKSGTKQAMSTGPDRIFKTTDDIITVESRDIPFMYRPDMRRLHGLEIDKLLKKSRMQGKGIRP
jgi:hypothetical protein